MKRSCLLLSLLLLSLFSGLTLAQLDTDGDGVDDYSDSCPTVPGPASNAGCPLPPPDRDGDGLPDATDPCPNDYGTSNGCPVDSDNDGWLDHADACPTVPGSNGGCPGGETPVPDSDSDGLPDTQDACPNQAARTRDGCPPYVPAVPPADGKCYATPSTNNRVNVRQEPDTTAPIVGVLSPNQQNEVLASLLNSAGETWYNVRRPNGDGFVSATAVVIQGRCANFATPIPIGAVPSLDGESACFSASGVSANGDYTDVVVFNPQTPVVLDVFTPDASGKYVATLPHLVASQPRNIYISVTSNAGTTYFGLYDRDNELANVIFGDVAIPSNFFIQIPSGRFVLQFVSEVGARYVIQCAEVLPPSPPSAGGNIAIDFSKIPLNDLLEPKEPVLPPADSPFFANLGGEKFFGFAGYSTEDGADDRGRPFKRLIPPTPDLPTLMVFELPTGGIELGLPPDSPFAFGRNTPAKRGIVFETFMVFGDGRKVSTKNGNLPALPEAPDFGALTPEQVVDALQIDMNVFDALGVPMPLGGVVLEVQSGKKSCFPGTGDCNKDKEPKGEVTPFLFMLEGNDTTFHLAGAAFLLPPATEPAPTPTATPTIISNETAFSGCIFAKNAGGGQAAGSQEFKNFSAPVFYSDHPTASEQIFLFANLFTITKVRLTVKVSDIQSAYLRLAAFATIDNSPENIGFGTNSLAIDLNIGHYFFMVASFKPQQFFNTLQGTLTISCNQLG